MEDLSSLTIKEASDLLQKGEISATELTQSCLDCIAKNEKDIHAFITICGDYALDRAKIIDKTPIDKRPSVLAGIPYSLKDVYVTKGIKTTAGSAILKDFVPPYSATVHQKLEDAGAILLGKTNCDPFGFGSSTEHSAYGVTRNPVDLSRVPGGSSGGSAAAVKYGGGLFSIGEDTGGSIRCPASFCGIVGLKPTYGRVSRYGAIAYASSYDSIGPLTKTVEDNALVLSVIAGKDPHDATTEEAPVPDYSEQLTPRISGKTIGIPKEYFSHGLHQDVRTSIENAIATYKDMGCIVKEISLPLTEYAIAIYYIIGLSEASSNLARYDGIRFGPSAHTDDWSTNVEETRGNGFGPEEKRRIMVGSFALSAGYQDKYYKRAQTLRQQLRADFDKAFSAVDVIVTPTMPVPPFEIGENLDDPLQMWLFDAYTVSINPVGVPALSIPVRPTTDGLPIGMQLIARHFKEELLFNFAYQYEHS